MKIKFLALLCLLMLAGCGREVPPIEDTITESTATEQQAPSVVPPETVPLETEPKPEPKDGDLVRVADYIPDILVELKYASSDNFLGREIYTFSEVYLRYGTIKKLAAVQQDLLGQGLRLKIWDGFRPVSAQSLLWDACPDTRYVSHPVTGNRNHCRGNAVDLTIADLQGRELYMPTGFDDFSEYANRDYSDCPMEAAENAQLLQSIMEEHGFSGYFGEWWHFSDTEEYPVEECFDPSIISLWYADCMEYLTLREAPDIGAAAVTRIPVGEEVILLGYSDGDFAMVDYNGLRGYVLSSYLAPVEYYAEVEEGPPISLNKPQYRAVCENYISLRSEPDASAEVITQIPDGGTFILLEWSGSFALVDYNGLYGYVAVNYIEPA